MTFHEYMDLRALILDGDKVSDMASEATNIASRRPWLKDVSDSLWRASRRLSNELAGVMKAHFPDPEEGDSNARSVQEEK